MANNKSDPEKYIWKAFVWQCSFSCRNVCVPRYRQRSATHEQFIIICQHKMHSHTHTYVFPLGLMYSVQYPVKPQTRIAAGVPLYFNFSFYFHRCVFWFFNSDISSFSGYCFHQVRRLICNEIHHWLSVPVCRGWSWFLKSIVSAAQTYCVCVLRKIAILGTNSN